ncbi:MAG: hypothetical protein AB7J28_06155 [Hyphomonadaceae bacterium]
MLLHVGFETPTPEIMAAWGKWFAAAAPMAIDNAGLRGGREISRAGTTDLPMGRDALTGYTIINAESMDEAEALARANPFISSIRVYELVSH